MAAGRPRATRAVRFICMLVAAMAIVCAPAVSGAQDDARARRELASSDDVRVRVAAALWLGRSHGAGAREALEAALDDTSPAVRSAAAAALATLGDPQATVALERHARSEAVAGTRAQMQRASAALHTTQALSARYVVQIGAMRNNTNVRGSQLGQVLAQAARARAASLPGVVVAEPADAARLASARGIPLLTIDGSLTGLTQSQSGQSLTVRAQVQLVVKKDSMLKASITGAASAMDSVRVLSSRERLAAMQNDAVDGAVQSAMRRADSGLEIASR